MTKTRFCSLALAFSVAAMVIFSTACSELDDGFAARGSSGSTVLVYGTDAPGDVTILEVELIDVKLFADAHDAVGELLVPLGDDSIVDLVLAASSGLPGLFNEFGVPEGTWGCAEGTLALANVTIRDDQDEDVTCTSVANVPGSITIPRLCLRSPIVVGENGVTDFVFDLPVLRGEVLDNSGTCELEFDRGNARLMRLAEF